MARALAIAIAVLSLAFALAGPAWSQPAAPPSPAAAPAPPALSAGTVAELQSLVATLQDDKQRAALIQQLQTLIAAQNATPAKQKRQSVIRLAREALGWLELQSVRHLLGTIASIALVILIALLVWALVSAAIRRGLARADMARHGVSGARLRTLLPLARTTVLIAIVTMAAFIVLSQLGVDIAPLLAGAGIVGIAVGFGSQQLVHDIINGLFILIENTVTVGDWVDVGGGHVGRVEDMSIRSMTLRDGSGALHTVPFSTVAAVVNTNRGIGNAAIAVTIAPGQDIDRAASLLGEIAAAMREDAAFKYQMLSDFQLWGVDKVEGTGVTILGQIVCTDGGRWPVQREFNRRMAQRFAAEGIAFAVPTQSLILRDPEAVPRAPRG
ncbi:MAG TPA: mechanosensitive ion channel domain-containing protein [Stellaceae bacterium]|nr:mechanosensitive ion channel domain-containing protein [Stellaceae bacterium]